MMGPSHAVCGAVAGVALGVATPLSVNALGVPHDAASLAACALIASGSALVPDLDQRSSSISHSLTPLTEAIATVVGAVSGGHRNGTHSLLGVAVFALLARALTLGTFSRVLPWGWTLNVGLALIVLLLGALALRALKFDFGPVAGWVGALALALVLGFTVPLTQPWVALAMVAGYLAHLAGDALTTQGIPLFWPSTRLKARLPILGDAGSAREGWLVGALGLYGLAVAVLGVLGFLGVAW